MVSKCATLVFLAAITASAISFANPLGADSDLNIKGAHPLKDNLNIWYYGFDTALGGNIYFADVLDKDSKFFNYKGDPVSLHSKANDTSGSYEDTHNHYQNLFVQTINKVSNLNTVSVWGDSTSVVDGAKSWGGLFSARSMCDGFQKGGAAEKYGSPDLFTCDGNDNQLIGIEIDVLNNSKPGVFPNMSKTGLQVVGFGNPNSMAVEVRTEDTDRIQPGKAPRGAFEAGFYMKNSIQPKYGRMIVADFDRAKMGIDFRKPVFSEGAMQFNTQGVGTGLVANGGVSGEIYGGRRWDGFADSKGWLSVRAGDGGFRVVSNDNTNELMAIDNYGGIYLNGDVYVNGERLNGQAVTGVNPWTDWRFLSFGIAFTLFNLLIAVRARNKAVYGT
ncbi:hypothetical protein [Pseudomonas sp. MWU12-3103b]|uniref:hypothetical protein n=1 Tax=Pseudomonas sp. MWU12-3103b TaxID=2928857 RepID=UPI00200000FD|nr:hypothetical protein [Pseudomonas sp. MWU12-3103b]